MHTHKYTHAMNNILLEPCWEKQPYTNVLREFMLGYDVKHTQCFNAIGFGSC